MNPSNDQLTGIVALAESLDVDRCERTFLTTKGSNYTKVVLWVLVSCVSFLSGLGLLV